MAVNYSMRTLLYDAGLSIQGERIYVIPGTMKISGIDLEMESKIMNVSAGGGDFTKLVGYDVTTQIAMLSFDVPNDQLSNDIISRVFTTQISLSSGVEIRIYYSAPNNGGLFGSMVITNKPERTFSSDATISLEFQGSLYSI